MKNVTIALDDEVHRKARVRAAELGTSLSALVKDYLVRLVSEGEPAVAGVREMPQTWNAPPVEAKGPPWLINGEWVYTKDGKPRQPGSLRKPGKMIDLPETPDWLIEAMEHWDETDFDPIP